jgi:O-antigen ligase
LSCFIIWAFIALINSDVYLIDGLFGLNNRNEGLISYLALAVFFVSSSVVSSKTFHWKIIKCIIFIGILSACYGAIQLLGLDWFNYYNRYNQVITFFGNPNFQSSFMGISAIAAIAHLRDQSIKKTFRTIMLIFVFLAIFVMNKTGSFQGYLILLVGLVVIVICWLNYHIIFKKYMPVYFLTTGVLLLALVLDLLQKSPWKSFTYQSSLSYRGDFWRAAWKMTFDNPLFGVGITGFRDNYRGYRDSVAVSRSEFNQVVESAHNKFLDIASSGGIILLVLYTAIVLLVITSGIKVIKRSQEFNSSFVAIFACWFAYLAQSTISIFSFANEVIGWTLAGIIVGFEILTRDPLESNLLEKKVSYLPAVSVASIIGLFFVSTYVQSELKFKSAIEKGEVNLIVEKVKGWPMRNDRFYLVTQLLEKGGFPDRSIEIAREAVLLWPNNFEAWQLLYFSPNATVSEKDVAFSMMKKLDPLNSFIGKS